MQGFGLSAEEWGVVKRILESHPKVSAAILYGSRVKGTHKRFSDIDLTLEGEELSYSDLMRVSEQFYSSSLPYIVDLSLRAKLTNPELIDHIGRRGKIIYSRQG